MTDDLRLSEPDPEFSRNTTVEIEKDCLECSFGRDLF